MSFKPLRLQARPLKTFPLKVQKRRRTAGVGVLVAPIAAGAHTCAALGEAAAASGLIVAMSLRAATGAAAVSVALCATVAASSRAGAGGASETVAINGVEAGPGGSPFLLSSR